MPRAKKKSSISVPQALAAVSASLTQLMQAIAASVPAGGAAPAGGKVVAMPKVAVAAAKAQENPTYSKAQKGVWSKYTPAQREARIRKMLAARGVKRKPAAKKAK